MSPSTLASAPPASIPCVVLDTVRTWSDAGVLRHLDSAFAAFIAELDTSADAALIVAAALLSHLEGRGHSCLPLTALPGADPALFAWPPDTQPAGRRAVADAAGEHRSLARRAGPQPARAPHRPRLRT